MLSKSASPRIWLVDQRHGFTSRISTVPIENATEYVSADLLTTARKKAFKDAANVAANEMIIAEIELNESDTAYNKAIGDVITALEAAATTEKGENSATD